MIRPVDAETIQDICRDVALDNYGFLYVNDHKEYIQTEYESAETGLRTAGTVSLSDIKQTLQDDTGRNGFERRRNGVYYFNSFNSREGYRVSDELKSIFTYDFVVNKQTIESRFDIAPADVDFFASELANEDYIRRIAAGERAYYVSGPRLKDETSGDASVDSRLNEEAEHGTISHTDLERVIDVAATSDVIRFFEKNDFIADIDDEYVVKSALDDYAAHLANAVSEDSIEEFGDIGILPLSEFQQVIENEINDRFDVLKHLSHGDTSELLELVREHIAANNGLTVDRKLAIDSEQFEIYVTRRATQIRDDIESEQQPPSPSAYRDHGYPQIESIEVTDSQPVNKHLREHIKEKFDTLVNERFSVESDV
jgi:hypothetical protein